MSAANSEQIARIRFSDGTIILENPPPIVIKDCPNFRWDKRCKVWRSPAKFYQNAISVANKQTNSKLLDQACNFKQLTLRKKSSLQPRDYQNEALITWEKANRKGVVVLPTGAGKTMLALMAIAKAGVSTLVQTPTLDLMRQWQRETEKFFGVKAGQLGESVCDLREITIATYDSALLRMPDLGDRFGLVVYDECHRLPGPKYSLSSLMSIAPYRLGLTATPNESNENYGEQKKHTMSELVGEIIYRAHIDEFAGNYLSEYETHTIAVPLPTDLRARYDENRAIYLNFLRSRSLRIGSPRDWQRFIFTASRSEAGRRAFAAYLEQKKIAQSSRAKETELWKILLRHRGERIIIFTQDNESAYRIGARFLLPTITHRTKSQAREDFLNGFRVGKYPALVTSKVLNEGVDIPQANVAVIVSGSGSVREHVQRLGRILRPQAGKKAIFYELVSADTAETNVNKRRRRHRAYA